MPNHKVSKIANDVVALLGGVYDSMRPIRKKEASHHAAVVGMTSHMEGARDRDALREGPLPPLLGVSTSGGGGVPSKGVGVPGREWGLGA